jgi:Tfp pilus assembly protein PilF
MQLDRIQEKAPESFEAWLGKGLLYNARGQLQAALNSFRKAAELNPQSFRVNLEIAKCLRGLKMNQQSQAAFLKTQSHISNARQLMTFTQELNRIK